MLAFVIKKTFYDMWDNMIRIILLNLGFLIVACLFFFFLKFLKFNTLLFCMASGITFVSVIWCYGVISRFTLELSNYNLPGFRDIIGYFKETFAAGLFLSLILFVSLLIVVISIPFYMKTRNIAGLAGVSIIFWISVIFFLSLSYYYPVLGMLGGRPVRILKKCFLIFIDNIGFTIFIAAGIAVIIAISVFLGFIVPGISTAALWVNAGLKIRLYKYDYLEANPGANRRKIPWKSLISEENEILGKRTLKDFIFPARQ